MSAVPIAHLPDHKRGFATVCRAGAVLGVVDGVCAIAINVFAFHQTSVMRTFQGIASAVLGTGAFDGGGATALLGLLMHFTVAFFWVTLYTTLYRASPSLRQWTRLRLGVAGTGAVLGIILWFAMNFVVFPMTKVHHAPVFSWRFQVYLIQHILVVGPLVVWAVARG